MAGAIAMPPDDRILPHQKPRDWPGQAYQQHAENNPHHHRGGYAQATGILHLFLIAPPDSSATRTDVAVAMPR